MTRTQAYKMMLMGKIVKHIGKAQAVPPITHVFGSTTPPVECYYKRQVPDKVVWNSDPTSDDWAECSIYDPIFWGEFDFIWSVYEQS
jgi:hypothetical protein